MYETELKIAKQAVRSASKFLKPEFFNWKIGGGKLKNGDEIVTYCDKKSEKIILTKLKKHFPKYTVLSEEKGLIDNHSDYFWTIDPLDGTSNFTNHNPFWAVSISLFYKKEVVLGVTYCPILDEMYWAIKNQGAYKNKTKLKISQEQNIKKYIIGYNHGTSSDDTKKIFKMYYHFQKTVHRTRNFYCTSLQMALTAGGYLDAYMVKNPHIWDVAAGIILLQEAGATLTDWKNKPWIKNSKSILASNKKMHPILLKELKKLKLA